MNSSADNASLRTEVKVAQTHLVSKLVLASNLSYASVLFLNPSNKNLTPLELYHAIAELLYAHVYVLVGGG